MDYVATEYAPVVRAQNGDYSAAALVGANTVVLGWNMAPDRDRTDLLGFAVRRTDLDPETGEVLRLDWLKGQKRFKSVSDDGGIDVRSDQAPFQRFRWSDYTVSAQRAYVYEVFPMRGEAGKLEREDPVRLDLRPSRYFSDGLGVYTNRGVTAAHAYLDRFGNRTPFEEESNAIRTWLSRGLKESLLGFINQAQHGDALHVAIYEFHDEDVAKTLQEAQRRGVDVLVVYHGAEGDDTTEQSEELLRHVELEGKADARTNAKISHNKFVVHLRGDEPRAVWTGSANFTDAGFYLQTNIGVVAENAPTAEAYEQYFQVLRKDPERMRKKKGRIAAQDEVESVIADSRTALDGDPWDLYFSPVRSEHIVDAAIELISTAQSAVFMSAPFAMDRRIIEALKANDASIIEYGLSNSTAKKKIEELNRHNTRFFTPTRLKTYLGRAWDARAFGSHKIHAKTLVIDPWGESPAVLIGSSNFSKPSCRENDENALLAQNHPRLAAMVATEFLRMFDHYKSRFFINSFFTAPGDKQHFLAENGSWSNTAFRADARSHKFRDRLVFSGSG